MVKRGDLPLTKLPQGWGTDDQPWPPRQLLDWIGWANAQTDPPWIIPGIIPFDAAVLVSGRAKKAKKTWFAFEIALSIASGKSIVPALMPTCAVPVLVLELEGPAKLTANRWEMLLKPFANTQFRCPIYYAHRLNFLLDDVSHMEEVTKFVQEAGIKFMIIDTLAQSNRADENSVQQIGEVMRRIKDLRAAMKGGTVAYLHHLRKPSEIKGGIKPDIDTEIRGTSALSGFYDVHLCIREPDDEHSDYLDLTVRQSDAMEKFFKLYWTIDSECDMKATLRMEEESPDMVDEEFANEKLGLLMDDAQYSVRDLAATWGTSQDVAVVARDLLLASGGLLRAGKNKVKRS